MEQMTNPNDIINETKDIIDHFKKALLSLNNSGLTLIDKQDAYNLEYLEDADITKKTIKNIIEMAVDDDNV